MCLLIRGLLINMGVVSAFLIPGSPLPHFQDHNPPWNAMAGALSAAGSALEAANPDSIIVYSTQWIAVLDQLWQTRDRVFGRHVDENWHEFGALEYDIEIDVDLANACIESSEAVGVKSKAVDYDGFPIDTGTIIADTFLNTAQKPLVVTSNNVYHDMTVTETIGKLVADSAMVKNKDIAIVGVGGLSGAFFRKEINPREDKIFSEAYDSLNRQMLDLISTGDCEKAMAFVPHYNEQAKPDMGFKQFGFIAGALNHKYSGAEVHYYGPLYGAGGAVVEFRL